MNILYIAYSCNPYEGSEDKIGWSVPAECAKNNRVFVITKEEQREPVERYLKEHAVHNMEFSFVDIPQVYKKVFRGSLYSGRLNTWNRRALTVAKKICEEKKIDLIHQVTPVEYRAIGQYHTIPNVKFVCGPLGGGEQIPKGLEVYAREHKLVESIRTWINRWCACSLSWSRKLSQCDRVLFANRETRDYLLRQTCDTSRYAVVTEVAVDTVPAMREKVSGKTVFLAAGRMIYRKGFAFLLDAMELLPEDADYACRIVGGGPDLEKLKTRCRNSKKLSKHVVFTGPVPHAQMEQEYERADVLVMPSIRETTGSVLLEAMSKGLPVITIGKFGGAVLLDEDTGWLYEGTDRDSYLDGLKGAMEACIMDRKEVCRRSTNARKKAEKYTWEMKNTQYQCIYRDLLDRK